MILQDTVYLKHIMMINSQSLTNDYWWYESQKFSINS